MRFGFHALSISQNAELTGKIFSVCKRQAQTRFQGGRDRKEKQAEKEALSSAQRQRFLILFFFFKQINHQRELSLTAHFTEVQRAKKVHPKSREETPDYRRQTAPLQVTCSPANSHLPSINPHSPHKPYTMTAPDISAVTCSLTYPTGKINLLRLTFVFLSLGFLFCEMGWRIVCDRFRQL